MKNKVRFSANSHKGIEDQTFSALWPLGVIVATLLILFISYELSPLFDYNRWDNFEQLTSTLFETHGQWFRGILPLWNSHQHLGEPLLVTVLPAVFYFPYTIITGFMLLFGVNESNFCLIVIITHLPLMALGFYLLAHSLGARPHVAWLSSLSITFSGYFTAVSTVWIFLVPILTWLPFALLGALYLITKKRSLSGLILLSGSVAMLLYGGHSQFATYALLTVLCFSLGYVLFQRSFKRLPLLLVSFISGVLLSAPSLVSAVKFLPYTSRGESFSKESFISYGAIPQALWGLISPAFKVDNGFIVSGASIMFYAGAWLLPALVLGAIVLFVKRSGATEERTALRAGFAAFLLSGLLLLLFSLGKWGGIYGLTYGVPVWSSFRWPHKFIPFAMVMLGLAGTLGLEAYLRAPGVVSRRIKALVAAAFIALSIVGLIRVGLTENSSIIAFIVFAASIISALTALWSHNKWSSYLLLIAVFVSSMGVVSVAQRLPLKTYSEKYASVGAERLGITRQYRVMPLSRQRWYSSGPSAMQEHGLFQSATINNYYSLTGCTFDLIPKLYLRYLPSNIEGLLPPSSYPALLTGPFLSSLNVRYYIVAREDAALIAALERSPRYRRINELSRVYVYERGDAARRAFFAGQTVKFDEKNFLSWMSSYNESPYKAHVEGLANTLWPDGPSVLDIKDDDGRVEVNIKAPDKGFLVLAYTWYPTWRAFVDGVETRIYRVNGVIQGIEVPGGARHVELLWSKRNVMTGVGLMIMGVIFIAGILLFNMRSRNRGGSRRP